MTMHVPEVMHSTIFQEEKVSLCSSVRRSFYIADVRQLEIDLHVFLLRSPIGHYRNVRGLGKSMVVFCLFEKLRYSNERSTIF